MAEADGWDGIALTDSQNLGGDTFAALALAAYATSTLQLATGATNCATRHPAVVASAIATIQVESQGRAHLGVARGDSALAFIGRKPQPLREFERGVLDVRRYLNGETVECDGFASRLEWLPPDLARVPVGIAATGPRVIEVAGRIADRVTLSVGADVGRLRRAMALARDAAVEALPKTRVEGLPSSASSTVESLPTPPSEALPNSGVEPLPNTGVQALPRAGLGPLSLGAYVNAVADPDIRRARELVRGRLSVYARFSTMDSRVMEALPNRDREVAHALRTSYDLKSHAASGAHHEAALTDDFVDRFGVVGPSEQVASRLVELAQLGLDHFIIVGHGRNVPPDVLAESSRRFGREVIPAVRAALVTQSAAK
jgi:5,10-methylenetetrahydromethanopterin reductase